MRLAFVSTSLAVVAAAACTADPRYLTMYVDGHRAPCYCVHNMANWYSVLYV